MKLLVYSSYGYQIMNGNRRTVLKHLDDKTRASISNELFM